MQTLRKIFKKLNKFRGVVAPPSEPPYPALIGEKSSMISKTYVWHASCIRTDSARKPAPRADGAAFGTLPAYTSLTYLSVYAVGAPWEQQKTACGARLRAYRGKTMNHPLAGKLERKDYESLRKDYGPSLKEGIILDGIERISRPYVIPIHTFTSSLHCLLGRKKSPLKETFPSGLGME